MIECNQLSICWQEQGIGKNTSLISGFRVKQGTKAYVGLARNLLLAIFVASL